MKLAPLRRLGALLSSVALGAGLGACETDLDSNDDYRETTLLYAVLDPGQPVQRISINKAFLNRGANAITIAAGQPDSVTFPAGTLDARLQVLRPDSSVKVEYPLERVANTSKQPGEFAQSGQVVYQTPAGFPGLDPDTAVAYRVVVRNNRTGGVAQGVTNVPRAFDPANPNATGNYLYFTSAYGGLRSDQQQLLRELDPAPPLAAPRVAIRTQARAGIYSVEVDFTFLEIVGTDTTRRTLTWPVITNERAAYPAVAEVSRTLANDAFFTDFLLPQIKYASDPAGLRRIIVNPVIFRATAGSPQWARYLDIVSSGSATSQVTPEYTNVRGGRGLVTGRVQHSIPMEIRTLLPNDKGRRAFSRFPQLKFDL